VVCEVGRLDWFGLNLWAIAFEFFDSLVGLCLSNFNPPIICIKVHLSDRIYDFIFSFQPDFDCRGSGGFQTISLSGWSHFCSAMGEIVGWILNYLLFRLLLMSLIFEDAVPVVSSETSRGSFNGRRGV